MLKIKKKIRGKITVIKFYYCLFLGKIFGISYIIRYLRNPDPLLNVKLLRSFGASIGEKTVIKRLIVFL